MEAKIVFVMVFLCIVLFVHCIELINLRFWIKKLFWSDNVFYEELEIKKVKVLITINVKRNLVLLTVKLRLCAITVRTLIIFYLSVNYKIVYHFLNVFFNISLAFSRFYNNRVLRSIGNFRVFRVLISKTSSNVHQHQLHYTNPHKTYQ